MAIAIFNFDPSCWVGQDMKGARTVMRVCDRSQSNMTGVSTNSARTEKRLGYDVKSNRGCDVMVSSMYAKSVVSEPTRR